MGQGIFFFRRCPFCVALCAAQGTSPMPLRYISYGHFARMCIIRLPPVF